ncbi:MAG TPA: hypothetical protein PKD37_07620 [Oligoflexia bacterium]|nr:hypothetical protein [Oligoflexia bacterium]HMP27831.1 hypothetical protein [Oligoflexia bacterium]
MKIVADTTDQPNVYHIDRDQQQFFPKICQPNDASPGKNIIPLPPPEQFPRLWREQSTSRLDQIISLPPSFSTLKISDHPQFSGNKFFSLSETIFASVTERAITLFILKTITGWSPKLGETIQIKKLGFEFDFAGVARDGVPWILEYHDQRLRKTIGDCFSTANCLISKLDKIQKTTENINIKERLAKMKNEVISLKRKLSFLSKEKREKTYRRGRKNIDNGDYYSDFRKKLAEILFPKHRIFIARNEEDLLQIMPKLGFLKHPFSNKGNRQRLYKQLHLQAAAESRLLREKIELWESKNPEARISISISDAICKL